MLIALLCVFLAVTMLIYSVMSRSAPETDRRLTSLSSQQPAASATRGVEAGPSRRDALNSSLRQMLPSRMVSRLGGFLLAASVKTQPEVVLLMWAGAAIGLPVLYLLLAAGSGIGQQQLLVALGLGALSGYAPFVLLRSRIRRRRKKLLTELPDMMDLLTTCVESGLGIDAALSRVAEKAREPLGEEIRLVLRAMAMGRARREALLQFANRSGLPELVSFTGAVIQAETMGVSLGHVLRVQSDALRVQRKQAAEQQAFKAPVKIVVVLALLIFPSMFIVIMGPAALQFMTK